MAYINVYKSQELKNQKCDKQKFFSCFSSGQSKALSFLYFSYNCKIFNRIRKKTYDKIFERLVHQISHSLYSDTIRFVSLGIPNRRDENHGERTFIRDASFINECRFHTSIIITNKNNNGTMLKVGTSVTASFGHMKYCAAAQSDAHVADDAYELIR